MAIAYNSSASAGSTSTSSLSYSHSCTGSNLVLVVFVKIFNTSNLVTGVTYNGVSMTQVLSGQDADNRWSYAYILANPATGANNVVVSLLSSTFVGSISQSYSGCNVSGIPDASGSLNTNSTTVTTTITTTVNGCWLVGSFNGSRVYSAGSGTTVRQSNTSADYIYGFDSNGAKAVAGSHSLVGTQATGANSRNYIISIAPYVDPFTPQAMWFM